MLSDTCNKQFLLENEITLCHRKNVATVPVHNWIQIANMAGRNKFELSYFATENIYCARSPGQLHLELSSLISSFVQLFHIELNQVIDIFKGVLIVLVAVTSVGACNHVWFLQLFSTLCTSVFHSAKVEHWKQARIISDHLRTGWFLRGGLYLWKVCNSFLWKYHKHAA